MLGTYLICFSSILILLLTPNISPLLSPPLSGYLIQPALLLFSQYALCPALPAHPKAQMSFNMIMRFAGQQPVR